MSDGRGARAGGLHVRRWYDERWSVLTNHPTCAGLMQCDAVACPPNDDLENRVKSSGMVILEWIHVSMWCVHHGGLCYHNDISDGCCVTK